MKADPEGLSEFQNVAEALRIHNSKYYCSEINSVIEQVMRSEFHVLFFYSIFRWVPLQAYLSRTIHSAP
jgi:hypothetical protein